MNCCYYYQEYDYLSPSSVIGGVGGSDVLVPQYRGVSCNGVAFGPFTDSAASWSSNNTAVATCSSSGTVSYVGAGSTIAEAYLYNRYYVPNLCKCQGKVQWVQAGAKDKACDYTVQPYNGFLAMCDDLQHTANFQLAVSPSSDQQACAINTVSATLSYIGGNFSPSNLQYHPSPTQAVGRN